MRKLLFTVLITACLTAGCFFNRGDSNSANRSASAPAANSAENSNAPGTKGVETGGDKVAEIANEIAPSKKECESTNVGDHTLLKSQTFPLTFEPFKNTCFVTSHNPEFDDPPLESEIALYKGDKKVFDFPNQFNGVTTGCWVEAVAFQDLNADGLTDIIVVGKCSAKTAPYNENVVYVNTGRVFTTNETANYEVAELKKAGDIADFVKRNQKLFFK
jgi:hypothetical protein